MNERWIYGLRALPVLGVVLLIAACSWSQELIPGSSSTRRSIVVAEDQIAFSGVVRRGADLGEVKAYCSEGLYLVADEGFLVDQTRILLLRVRSTSSQAAMLSDQQYIDKNVEVLGKYPAQQYFCEALICACEDYILVERINIR